MTHVDRSRFGLSDVQADVWQGFVFVNLDLDAPPLPEYLGGIVEHCEDIARPPLRDRYKPRMWRRWWPATGSCRRRVHRGLPPDGHPPGDHRLHL